MGLYFSDKKGTGLRILLDENMCSKYDETCVNSIRKYFEETSRTTPYIVELGDVDRYGLDDPDVYKVGSQNKFDLIFTRDAKMADVHDLCSVANEAFVNPQEGDKKVPLVVFGRGDVAETLRRKHRDIVALGNKRNYAILDTRRVSHDENLTGTHNSIADFWIGGGQSIHHNAYR